jgi:hypothetical protein
MDKLILTLFSVIIIGCAMDQAYRPMQVGMVWEETEQINRVIDPGLYLKTSRYTAVYPNGQYNYETSYNRLGD